MKKILIAAIATLGTMSLFAQMNIYYTRNDAGNKSLKKQLRENEVSYQVKEQLYRDFTDISNVQWSKGPNFDEAVFTQNEKVFRAFYDVNDELVGTTTHKTTADLPENAKQKISKEYPNAAIQDVILFDDNEANETDMIIFGSQFQDADNYFVEMKGAGKDILLRVDMSGGVYFFKDLASEVSS